MAEYINKYANDAAIQAAVDGGELLKPYVAYDESANTIDWNSKLSPTEIPLTFEILSNDNLNINATGVSYSINDGEWLTTSSNPTTISLSSGDKIKFKATVIGKDMFKNNTIKFNVYGNIMSLVDSTGYATATTISSNNAFKSTFYNCTGLTDASNLLLPATTLAGACYSNMFRGCTGLTTAPELPATTLVNNCYENMFQNCRNLTTAPELSATTLARACYAYMFQDCKSLHYIKCLATDISAGNCTYCWVSGMASSGTFVTPSTTSWSTGVSGIPSGWTRVNSD